MPRPVKNVIKKFWDPWAIPRRVPPRSRRLKPVIDNTPAALFDVVCFSIIDWGFRWQRPQQLLSQFADLGHRVFVIKTSAFLPPGSPGFELSQLRENVWEVTLAPPVVIDVYGGVIDPATVEWFPSMLDEMRCELNIVSAVSVVQVATWGGVALDARTRFGWRVVYDCMDEWNTFPGMKRELLAAEERLVGEADLVTVSGKRLLEKWRGRNPHVELIRNAADFEFFSAAAGPDLLAGISRPIAGYFGAVAPWFDLKLLHDVAAARPLVSFVVIGGVFDVDVSSLKLLPNVHLLGQQPYSTMPAYLRDFDACLIPFVVNEITAATDPVKFYEYISRGKPVVSTFMPELDDYASLLYFARDASDFAAKLDSALAEDDVSLRESRVALARANTWRLRAAAMSKAIAEVHARCSIIIVSYDNCEITRDCIDSVLANSVHPNLEVIVLDNGSSDGSAEMLSRITDDRVKVVLNQTNSGFAAANNQGLALATGDYLVLLNNDTVVPRGWLPRLLRHLDDPQIGIGVAVTNFSGNESRIEVSYDTIEGMHDFAQQQMRRHDGEFFDIRVAAMYCVGMRREVLERVGPLDERFGIGMFEDDDYSHRVRLAGYRVVCMEDVFVHHIGQASFARLEPDEYDALWRTNQTLFETKWGLPWSPHKGR